MDLVELLAGSGEDVRLLQAIVTSSPSGGKCTIRLADSAGASASSSGGVRVETGSSSADDIAGVSMLASAVVVNGDTVWVLAIGGAFLVIGKVGPNTTPAATSTGRLIQSGSTVVTTDGGGGAGVTFPVAFSVKPAVTICNGDIAVGSDIIMGIEYGHASTNAAGFWFTSTNSAGARVLNTTVRVSWIAFGAA